MTALLAAFATPLPLLYRWLAIGMLALAVFGTGFVKGVQHDEAKNQVAFAKAAVETVKIAKAREVVSTLVVTKYVPQAARAEVITETIVKEIPVYALPSDPPLPGRFRVFHDAAAQGLVPDSAGVADAAPVPLPDAEAAVAENYGSCRQDRIRLSALQEWVANQLKVNPSTGINEKGAAQVASERARNFSPDSSPSVLSASCGCSRCAGSSCLATQPAAVPGEGTWPDPSAHPNF